MQEKSIFDKRVRDLEPEIAALARQAELGELRKIYHASTRLTGRNAGGWVLLAYGIVFFLFAILAVFSSASPAWLLPGPILAVPGILLYHHASMLAGISIFGMLVSCMKKVHCARCFVGME